MNIPDWTTLRTNFAITFSRLFSPFTLFVWGAFWIVAVLAGPFGTYAALTALMRTFYWGAIATGGVIIGFAVYALTLTLLGTENRRSFAPIAAVILTSVLAPFIIALRSLVALGSDGLLVAPVSITINTFVIAFAIFLCRQLLLSDAEADLSLRASEASITSVLTEIDPIPEPRLMRRLPEEVKGQILRVTANNHHVEVVTDKGQAELRMRLADAIDEMDPVFGFCVHRSHWITCAAIVRIERINAQKVIVHLSNGDQIPASRKYRVNLARAGLLPQIEAA